MYCDSSDIGTIKLSDLFSFDTIAGSTRPETVLFDYVEKSSFVSTRDLLKTIMSMKKKTLLRFLLQ